MIEEAIRHLDFVEYENIKNLDIFQSHDFLIPSNYMGDLPGVVLYFSIIPEYVSLSKYYFKNQCAQTYWHYCLLPNDQIELIPEKDMKNVARGFYHRRSCLDVIESKNQIFTKELKRKIIFNLDVLGG